MPVDVAAFVQRFAALRERVGVGTTDPAAATALLSLLDDLGAAARPAAQGDATELAWWSAAVQDAYALACIHLGDPAAAATAYRDAAHRWTRLGEAGRARDAQAAAADQAVAAGGSLDDAITALAAALPGARGLDRAVLLGRLARLAANVGDRYEALRRVDEAADVLAGLAYPDPDAEPAPAWLATPEPAAIADLRAFTAVVTTWYALLAARGAAGEGWPTAGLTRLAQLTGRLGAGAPGADRAAGLTAVAARLDALQDAYAAGPDAPDPLAWSRDYAALADVVAQAEATRPAQPALLASAHILEADFLTWAGRPDQAAPLLARARDRLETATAIGPADRAARLIELIRRQAEAAMQQQDTPAVSRFAGDGIALIEADRARLHLPYLQDSHLRDRRTVYVLGMAAARRLGDLELLLERADLVKARGTLDWLPVPPRPVAEIRAGLAADEAVVYHLWADRCVLYVLTVDRDDVVCDRVLFTDAERTELDALITDFAALGSAALWPDTELPPLGERLLPTDGARLLEGKSRLVLSPNGLLHQLPLHALTWRGRPLIESFAVSYAANLAALTPRPAAAAPGPPLVVGVGRFAMLPERSWLARTEDEARAVAAAWPAADLLLGAQASTAEFARRAGDGRLAAAPVLHLATHGDDGPLDDPLAARLLAEDGDVPAATVAAWTLRARLVVLSACWSAQRAVLGRDGTELFGDEVYGLQSAFFRAGAAAVLGAMWPANDDVAPGLMTAFTEQLVAGAAPDIALQRAVLAARDTHRLLYRWAPWKLTVLGRPAPPEEN